MSVSFQFWKRPTGTRLKKASEKKTHDITPQPRMLWNYEFQWQITQDACKGESASNADAVGMFTFPHCSGLDQTCRASLLKKVACYLTCATPDLILWCVGQCGRKVSIHGTATSGLKSWRGQRRTRGQASEDLRPPFQLGPACWPQQVGDVGLHE